jgi:hypothetical protein
MSFEALALEGKVGENLCLLGKAALGKKTPEKKEGR